MMNGLTASHEDHEVTKLRKPNYVKFFVAFVPSWPFVRREAAS